MELPHEENVQIEKKKRVWVFRVAHMGDGLIDLQPNVMCTHLVTWTFSMTMLKLLLQGENQRSRGLPWAPASR